MIGNRSSPRQTGQNATPQRPHWVANNDQALAMGRSVKTAVIPSALIPPVLSSTYPEHIAVSIKSEFSTERSLVGDDSKVGRNVDQYGRRRLLVGADVASKDASSTHRRQRIEWERTSTSSCDEELGYLSNLIVYSHTHKTKENNE